ncbi:MAG TPA: radical SAM protein [Candidatus Eremiobacteraeota bacterium]|nr:radical SAM protein [Candidatus Eremiobacteraeota bacterium]
MLDKTINPILFITVGYNPGKEGYKTNPAQMGHLSMATMLYERGYSVKLISSDYIDPDDLLSTVRNEHIGILAFYTTTEDIYRVIALVSRIKKHSPSTLIFLGGPHVSISQRDKDLEALRECPADLVVRGEGEYTLLSLASFYYEGKGELSGIKSITYRDGSELRRNSDAPLIENLDLLPIPLRELLSPESLMLEQLFPRILTGRGCPFNCAFCFDGIRGKRYRFRSVEHVMAEVDYILNTCPGRVITFIDNTFTVSARRISAICKGLRERREKGYDFAWSCLGRVNVLSKNLSLIDEMVESGLIYLQLGVESGDPEILNLYNKKINHEEIRKVISYCEQAGVCSVLFNVILGGPFESSHTYKSSLDFCIELLKLAPGRAFCTGGIMLSPYPMTAIEENPEKYGLKIIDPDFKRGLSVQKVPFTETEHFNKYDLTRLQYQFEESIKEAMRQLFPLIPRKTILRHIEVGHRYGNISLWMDVMKLDPGIRVFYNLIRYSVYRDYYDIPPEDVYNWHPLRTYELMYNENNFCIINRGDGTSVVMDERGSFLYEYSAGKITLQEIGELFKEKFSLSPEHAFQEMKNFYDNMAQIFAVIFSKV